MEPLNDFRFVQYVDTSTGLQALDVRGWEDVNHLVQCGKTNRIVLEALYATTSKTAKAD